MNIVDGFEPVEVPTICIVHDHPEPLMLVVDVRSERGEAWVVIEPTETGGPRLRIDLASMRRLVAAWIATDGQAWAS